MVEKAPGLRERTRRAVAGELSQAAMKLFLSQGYEVTTVDQIATAAGMSQRSFFRYFASKDDVLGQALATTGETLAAAVTAQPVDDAPWATLRRAFQVLVQQMESDERALELTRLMLESPNLQSSHAQKQTSWRNAIAASLEPRLPPETDHSHRRLQAQAVSGAAIACLITAQAEWVTHNGMRPLSDLLDTAMNAVARSATS